MTAIRRDTVNPAATSGSEIDHALQVVTVRAETARPHTHGAVPPGDAQPPGSMIAAPYAAAAEALRAATIWSAVRPVSSAMWSNLQI
jgi:hypothetical protein